MLALSSCIFLQLSVYCRLDNSQLKNLNEKKCFKRIEFLPHTLIFNPYNIATCSVVDLRYTLNSVRSNSLKYQMFTSSGFEDIGIRKIDFVAKTKFLSFFVQDSRTQQL